MGRGLFYSIADNTNPHSLSRRFRRRRFELFQRLLLSFPGKDPVRILDLGGDANYWQDTLRWVTTPVEITLLNLFADPTTGDPRIQSIAGDARNLAHIEDLSFDIVHSNSLIEHLGSYPEQQRMAQAVSRIGRAYFIQTPNRFFPLEPHFLLPFVQFLPASRRAYLAGRFQPGWYRTLKVHIAAEDARRLRLLARRELRALFPDGQVWQERLFGLVKSFVIYRFGVISDQLDRPTTR